MLPALRAELHAPTDVPTPAAGEESTFTLSIVVRNGADSAARFDPRDGPRLQWSVDGRSWTAVRFGRNGITPEPGPSPGLIEPGGEVTVTWSARLRGVLIAERGGDAPAGLTLDGGDPTGGRWWVEGGVPADGLWLRPVIDGRVGDAVRISWAFRARP